jgi:DNA mismatch endonuclease (patch repair protein)
VVENDGRGLTRPIVATFPVVPDALTQERRSWLMSRVRTRDTKPEMLLRHALWAAGLRGWRLHPKTVPGRPDLAWLGRRVAVFVDGAFWHGHPDYYWGQSGKFWDEKIARNRARDVQINAELAKCGWCVVRLWDFEVERDVGPCVERVRSVWEAGDASTSISGPNTNTRSISVRADT